MKMSILVGTSNERKIEAVKTCINSMGVPGKIEFSGCSVESGLSDTPLGIDTKTGAINRAISAKEIDGEKDLYVGIESGLVERYGDYYEEVWVAILHKEKTYYAYSSGILLPEKVSSNLSADVINHPQMMNKLRAENGIDMHQEWGVDTWGNYTGNKILREVGLEEAIRNTLVQIFPGEDSFYNA